MSYNSQICCFCEEQFDKINQPRMMPSCDHNICTKCLQTSFQLNNKQIMCIFCQTIQQIQENHLQNFPKNISLIKALKQIKTNPNKSFKNIFLQQNNQILLQRTVQINQIKLNNQINQNKKQITNICNIHSKEMQLICLKDYTRLCPLCALFGCHKQHKIKTISQVLQTLTQTQNKFSLSKDKKKKIDALIKDTAFKNKLVFKLNQIKTKYSNQIAQKFDFLRQLIDTAEDNAYDDLNKKVKQIYDNINNLVKQKCQFEHLYNDWSANISLIIQQGSKININLQKKIKSYYQGPINSIKQGNFYLNQIQSYMNQKLMKIQRIPDQLILQFNQSIIKDIYNYLSVKIQDENYSQFTDNDSSTSKNIFGSAKILQNTLADSNYYNSVSFKSYCSQDTLKQQNLINNTSKKPIKVEFSSSNEILTPPNKNKPNNFNNNCKKSSLQQKNNIIGLLSGNSTVLLQNQTSNKLIFKGSISLKQKQELQFKKIAQQKISQAIQTFCNDQHIESLDLSGLEMNDSQILKVLNYVNNKKKIKCLKLSMNKLTNQGFIHMLPYIKSVTNLNITRNLLTEQVMSFIMKNRQKIPCLRILTLAHNKINQRKAKNFIDQIKKTGIIITV